MLLKVSPRKGISRFGKKGKLSSRYVGPFQITARVGHVAYRLALLLELSFVHDVSHVSMLRKSEHDPTTIVQQMYRSARMSFMMKCHPRLSIGE